MKLAIAVACAGLAACDRGPTPAIGSCRDSLAGMWRDPQGRDWSVIDHGARLEVYPAFPDTALPAGAAPADAELEVAPRVLDLQRAGDQITGTVHRRFMRGNAGCDPAVPIRVRACAGRSLQLDFADPPVPTSFAPCVTPAIAPPTVTTWTWRAALK